ncbi:MAG: alpha-amylase family glycosyl hydrolase, partial [Chloroflexota bacterium]
MTTPTRNLVIYEVFVRQHGPRGTFADVEADLPRIRDLGVDIVWLMPIHPIGKVARKGSLGSPYSIADYRAVNPEYGTLGEFTRLADAVHAHGMRLMIDVVYNHTAHDSRLAAEHPGFFHQDADGRPVTTVPDWSDVIDLRHGSPGLDEELISTLELWVDR